MSNFTKKSSWVIAKNESLGYSDPKLLEDYISEFSRNHIWEQVRNNKVYTSRIITAFNAIAMTILKLGGHRITVCDIGGGNGELAFSAIETFSFIDFDWNIYENSEIAKAYSEIAKDTGVKWLGFEKKHNFNCDIGILSSSVHYFDSPYSILSDVIESCKFLILLRLPLIDLEDDVAAVQTGINSLGTRVSIPYWFLAQEKLDRYLETNGEIVLKWKQMDEEVNFDGNLICMQGRLLQINSLKNS